MLRYRSTVPMPTSTPPLLRLAAPLDQVEALLAGEPLTPQELAPLAATALGRAQVLALAHAVACAALPFAAPAELRRELSRLLRAATWSGRLDERMVLALRDRAYLLYERCCALVVEARKDARPPGALRLVRHPAEADPATDRHERVAPARRAMLAAGVAWRVLEAHTVERRLARLRDHDPVIGRTLVAHLFDALRGAAELCELLDGGAVLALARRTVLPVQARRYLEELRRSALPTPGPLHAADLEEWSTDADPLLRDAARLLQAVADLVPAERHEIA